MSVMRSLLSGLREVRFNPFKILHALCYGATVTYLRVLKQIAKIDAPAVRNLICDTYHGKVITSEDARRIITINRDVEIRNLDQVLPYMHAKDLILKNPHNIAGYECPCRGQKKDPCRPTEVCLVIGDPFVDLLRMFQPFRSRRISPEEALQILREEDERGHIHTAWFKTAMLNRFYAICNCCKCCCLGMKFMAEHHMNMLIPSGYRSVVGQGCTGCGVCATFCQFDAMTLITSTDNGNERRRCEVIREKCFGCGICQGKCTNVAISLVLDPHKGVPLNIEALERSSAGVTQGASPS